MRPALLLACLALPAPLAAHPHVFVDSRVEVVTEGSLVTAIRLTWTYDEFFTLYLLEDLGLDPDADAVLTEEELAALQASVAAWPPDFTGDLVLTHGEGTVPLAPPTGHGAALVDGKLVETHTRPLEAPVDAAAAPLMVENYDPFYYVAYTILPDVALPAPCEARVIPVDPVAAQAEVDAIWQGLDVAGAGPEVELPPIGYAFSDRVEVRCAP